jgi:hypothetical protein
MTIRPRTRLPIALLAVAILISVALAWAVTAGYDLSWWTVNGGGAQNMAGGAYSLSGTAAQPDAGRMSARPYALQGGFWSPFAGPGRTAARHWGAYR